LCAWKEKEWIAGPLESFVEDFLLMLAIQAMESIVRYREMMLARCGA
jgi:hypothetical protein